MKKASHEIPPNPSERWLENASASEYLEYLLYKNNITAYVASFNLGYKAQNVVSTIVRGRMKLPVERIFDFANEFGADPYLLRDKVIRETFPKYYAEEQKLFYMKKIYPLPKQIMELATECGLKYGTLSKEETDILKEAFDKIKELHKSRGEE